MPRRLVFKKAKPLKVNSKINQIKILRDAKKGIKPKRKTKRLANNKRLGKTTKA